MGKGMEGRAKGIVFHSHWGRKVSKPIHFLPPLGSFRGESEVFFDPLVYQDFSGATELDRTWNSLLYVVSHRWRTQYVQPGYQRIGEV